MNVSLNHGGTLAMLSEQVARNVTLQKYEPRVPYVRIMMMMPPNASTASATDASS